MKSSFKIQIIWVQHQDAYSINRDLSLEIHILFLKKPVDSDIDNLRNTP
jgi:hypothetical protein